MPQSSELIWIIFNVTSAAEHRQILKVHVIICILKIHANLSALWMWYQMDKGLWDITVFLWILWILRTLAESLTCVPWKRPEWTLSLNLKIFVIFWINYLGKTGVMNMTCLKLSPRNCTQLMLKQWILTGNNWNDNYEKTNHFLFYLKSLCSIFCNLVKIMLYGMQYN